jgi:ABC-type phosphate transport system substrate-binding protein
MTFKRVGWIGMAALAAAAFAWSAEPDGDRDDADSRAWPYAAGAEEFPDDLVLAARWDELLDARERLRVFEAASEEERLERDWREGLPPIPDTWGWKLGFRDDEDEEERRRRQIQQILNRKCGDLRDDVAIAARRYVAAIFDRRMEELERLAPTDWPPLDMTRTPARPSPAPLDDFAPVPSAAAQGFDSFSYPRIDGSTSLLNLARLMGCRIWGAPYRWEGRPTGLHTRESRCVFGSSIRHESPRRYGDDERYWIDFRLAALPDGPFHRAAGLINDLINNFSGTHRAYNRLANPGDAVTLHFSASEPPEGELPPRRLRGEPADLLLVARRPSADEIETLAKHGVELDIRPFGHDAFVFLVNRRNPVRNLSADEIRSIYAGTAAKPTTIAALRTELRRAEGRGEYGKHYFRHINHYGTLLQDAQAARRPRSIPVSRWDDFGGPPRLLTAYKRERNSGSRELMDWLVMRDLRPAQDDDRRLPMAMTSGGMIGPSLAITDDPWGLAYSIWNYERYMRSGADVRVLSVDGVAPTCATIAAGTYPFIYDLVIVARKDLPPDSPAARLRDWLLGPDGQRVVRESGYVPLAEGRRQLP